MSQPWPSSIHIWLSERIALTHLLIPASDPRNIQKMRSCQGSRVSRTTNLDHRCHLVGNGRPNTVSHSCLSKPLSHQGHPLLSLDKQGCTVECFPRPKYSRSELKCWKAFAVLQLFEFGQNCRQRMLYLLHLQYHCARNHSTR
jgi:hypothetical protein